MNSRKGTIGTRPNTGPCPFSRPVEVFEMRIERDHVDILFAFTEEWDGDPWVREQHGFFPNDVGVIRVFTIKRGPEWHVYELRLDP